MGNCATCLKKACHLHQYEWELSDFRSYVPTPNPDVFPVGTDSDGSSLGQLVDLTRETFMANLQLLNKWIKCRGHQYTIIALGDVLKTLFIDGQDMSEIRSQGGTRPFPAPAREVTFFGTTMRNDQLRELSSDLHVLESDSRRPGWFNNRIALSLDTEVHRNATRASLEQNVEIFNFGGHLRIIAADWVFAFCWMCERLTIMYDRLTHTYAEDLAGRESEQAVVYLRRWVQDKNDSRPLSGRLIKAWANYYRFEISDRTLLSVAADYQFRFKADGIKARIQGWIRELTGVYPTEMEMRFETWKKRPFSRCIGSSDKRYQEEDKIKERIPSPASRPEPYEESSKPRQNIPRLDQGSHQLRMRDLLQSRRRADLVSAAQVGPRTQISNLPNRILEPDAMPKLNGDRTHVRNGGHDKRPSIQSPAPERAGRKPPHFKDKTQVDPDTESTLGESNTFITPDKLQSRRVRGSRPVSPADRKYTRAQDSTNRQTPSIAKIAHVNGGHSKPSVKGHHVDEMGDISMKLSTLKTKPPQDSVLSHPSGDIDADTTNDSARSALQVESEPGKIRDPGLWEADLPSGSHEHIRSSRRASHPVTLHSPGQFPIIAGRMVSRQIEPLAWTHGSGHRPSRRRGSSSRGSSPRGCSPSGSSPRGSSPRGSSPRGSSPGGSSPKMRRPINRGSRVHGSGRWGSSPQGTSPPRRRAVPPSGNKPLGRRTVDQLKATHEQQIQRESALAQRDGY